MQFLGILCGENYGKFPTISSSQLKCYRHSDGRIHYPSIFKSDVFHGSLPSPDQPLMSLPPSTSLTVSQKDQKGQNPPADVIAAAIMIAKIATGEIEEDAPRKSAAAELGAKGGTARAKDLTRDQRRAIAQAAAKARWRKQ